MRIDVIPNVKVNDIVFGMSRAEVRELLGEAKEFKKGPYASNTTDDFGFCHVFYDKQNKCEAVEIFDDPGVEVYLDDTRIFPTDLDEAKVMVDDFEIDGSGLISISLSIYIDAPDGEMESILFGKKDYYLD